MKHEFWVSSMVPRSYYFSSTRIAVPPLKLSGTDVVGAIEPDRYQLSMASATAKLTFRDHASLTAAGWQRVAFCGFGVFAAAAQEITAVAILDEAAALASGRLGWNRHHWVVAYDHVG